VRNIRGNVGYAQAPQLFLNSGGGKFRDVAPEAGNDFAKAKWDAVWLTGILIVMGIWIY
jgi:hypothetical protein